jgi:hypothetical protein
MMRVPPPERGGPEPEPVGDAACWANRVCPQCGRLADEERPVVCAECGAEFPDD